MFKLDLAKLSVLDGFIAAALVDLTSGTTLARYGNGFDLGWCFKKYAETKQVEFWVVFQKVC